MSETRLMGMADGSVAKQALIDDVWTFVPMAFGELTSAALDKVEFPPANKPRRGRPAKVKP